MSCCRPSNLLDFQELLATSLGDHYVTVRMIDIAFRFAVGAILVLLVVPLLLGYRGRDYRRPIITAYFVSRWVRPLSPRFG